MFDMDIIFVMGKTSIKAATDFPKVCLPPTSCGMADARDAILQDQARAKTEAQVAAAALQVAVGNRIRQVRIDLGYGQAECAKGAGIDTSSMFRIEKGDQNLTVHTLARLSLSLGVPIDELLIGVVADPAIVEPRKRS